jgi:hypothetical protein
VMDRYSADAVYRHRQLIGTRPIQGAFYRMKHIIIVASLAAVVLIAFTVPLGHSPRAEETEPRIELMVRQRAASGEFAALRRADDARWNERRIGFSLGNDPHLMLNGREIIREERKDGVSDGVWIAGGVTVALLISGLLFWDALEDASE